MPRTFESPASYHPSYSLLGRAIRAWVGDRLRGEALFIVTLTGLTLGVLMTHYLGWALLQPTLADHPWQQMLFWGGQVASLLLLGGLGLIGFRPAVRIRCDAETLSLRQGNRACSLSPTSIEGLHLIPAQQYHRHYRRYAATKVFLSTIPDEVILLRTRKGPIIVALPEPEAQTALVDHLEVVSASPAPVAEPQATS